jgi:hypothetical protein
VVDENTKQEVPAIKTMTEIIGGAEAFRPLLFSTYRLIYRNVLKNI